MDLLISGKPELVARARAAMASKLTTSAAHLTVSAEAQAIEDRLAALMHAQGSDPDRPPRFDDAAAAQLEAIDTDSRRSNCRTTSGRSSTASVSRWSATCAPARWPAKRSSAPMASGPRPRARTPWPTPWTEPATWSEPASWPWSRPPPTARPPRHWTELRDPSGAGPGGSAPSWPLSSVPRLLADRPAGSGPDRRAGEPVATRAYAPSHPRQETDLRRLAGGEDPGIAVRRPSAHRGPEGHGRLVERPAVGSIQAARVERAPVDRHDDPGRDEGSHRGGAVRVEMARSRMRPPPPDRQERDVGATREIRHGRIEPGVAREVQARRSFQQVAHRASPRLEGPAQMTRRHGCDRPVAESMGLAHLQGSDTAIRSLGGPAEALRDDHERIALEAAQGPRIEVVRVGVRDEDEVQRSDRRRVRARAVPAQRTQPVTQERVGQAAQTVGFDEDRRVADVREPHPARPQAPTTRRQPVRRADFERGIRVRVKAPPMSAPMVDSIMSSIVSW